jgi:hypothetical protein
MLKNTDLVAYVKKAVGSPYMYGVNGDVVTEELIKRKAIQYHDMYTTSYIIKCRRHIGKRAYDCTSLTDLFCGVDKSANGWRDSCPKLLSIDKLPDVPGMLVFMEGHMGVYIGNGSVVEARGIDYGVVVTKVKERPWTSCGKNYLIDYVTDEGGDDVEQISKGDKGLSVGLWQVALGALGYSIGKFGPAGDGVDMSYGETTEAATLKFKSDNKLPISDVVDEDDLHKALALLKVKVSSGSSAVATLRAENDGLKAQLSKLSATVVDNNSKAAKLKSELTAIKVKLAVAGDAVTTLLNLTK